MIDDFHCYGDNSHYADDDDDDDDDGGGGEDNDDCANYHKDGCDNVSYFTRRVTQILKQSKSFVA